MARILGLPAAGLQALSLIAVVFSLCLPASDTAAASGRRQLGQRPIDNLTVDEAFVAARAAMASENSTRFEQVAARASEHSLDEYVKYWSLRLRLAERSAERGAELDANVREFLSTHPGTLVADLLRRDWILNLGRRGDWPAVEAQHASWVLQDDVQAHCYNQTARAMRGEPAAAAARQLLSPVRDLGEACITLVETLLRQGQYKRQDVYRQLLVALEHNHVPSIRRLATLAGVDAERAESALTRPIRAGALAGTREVEQMAIARLARQDTAAARQLLSNSTLAGADRQFALAQIAAAAMRRLEPEALELAREVVGPQRRGSERASDANRTAAGANASSPVLPPTLVGDETWAWLARAALRAQDWPLLGEVVTRMSPAQQREPVWVYWMARSHAAAGRSEESEALMRSIAGQYHFYGQLAGEAIGQLSSTPPRSASPGEGELAEVGRNAGLNRALEFYRLGLRVEGNREWNFQLRGMNDRQLLAAAHWACQRKVLDRCVNTADRTSQEHDFALRFVSPFHEELKPIARDVGLDTAWVYGLIRQESRFIMDARSSVGASGLMQIMPATGRWIARKLGVADFRTEQLNELPTNLRFGTYYLKSVFDDLDGSPVLASAAYNAGPNRPRNWRSTLPGAVEGAIFAEIIPFTETRDYVKKVLSNTTYYAALFSGQPQSLRQRLGTVAPKLASPSELP